MSSSSNIKTVKKDLLWQKNAAASFTGMFILNFLIMNLKL